MIGKREGRDREEFGRLEYRGEDREDEKDWKKGGERKGKVWKVAILRGG